LNLPIDRRMPSASGSAPPESPVPEPRATTGVPVSRATEAPRPLPPAPQGRGYQRRLALGCEAGAFAAAGLARGERPRGKARGEPRRYHGPALGGCKEGWGGAVMSGRGEALHTIAWALHPPAPRYSPAVDPLAFKGRRRPPRHRQARDGATVLPASRSSSVSPPAGGVARRLRARGCRHGRDPRDPHRAASAVSSRRRGQEIGGRAHLRGRGRPQEAPSWASSSASPAWCGPFVQGSGGELAASRKLLHAGRAGLGTKAGSCSAPRQKPPSPS
jgi:hypothetical protein